MLCSGCGKTIPFNGSVCPYCQRDKSKDKAYTVWAFILGLGLGWLGYKLFGVWGAIGGFVAGCIAAYAMSGAGTSKLPEVRVLEDKGPAQTAQAQTSSEVRLNKLKDLLDKGLIDDAEYKARRKAIIDEL
jgi:glutaredoxin